MQGSGPQTWKIIRITHKIFLCQFPNTTPKDSAV